MKFTHSQTNKSTLSNVQLSYTPVTEIRTLNTNEKPKAVLTFALDDRDVNHTTTDFLVYLLSQRHKGSFAERTTTATLASRIDVNFDRNAFHNRHALEITSTFIASEKSSFQQSTQRVAAHFFSYLTWLTHPDNKLLLNNVYDDFRKTRLANCHQPLELNYEQASQLNNSIFFGALPRFLQPCELPETLPFGEFHTIVSGIQNMPLYTLILAPEQDYQAVSAQEQKMTHYQQLYKLVKPLEVESTAGIDFSLPKQNLWLAKLDEQVNPNDEVMLFALDDDFRFATNTYLIERIISLEDYAYALVLQEYIEQHLSEELAAAKVLGAAFQFKRDKGFRFTVTGPRAIAVLLANRVEAFAKHGAFDRDNLNIARQVALENWQSKARGNQLYRIGSYLPRLQRGQTWSQQDVDKALQEPALIDHTRHNPQQNKTDIRPNSQSASIWSRHSAPVNVLTSLHFSQDDSLEAKLFALMLNTLIKAEFKDYYRNRQKIAYTAVTDFQINDTGSGFVTLLQTSSMSIDEMKESTKAFTKRQYARINSLGAAELNTLFHLQKQTLAGYTAKPDVYFTDSVLSQANVNAFQQLAFSEARFREFARNLLTDSAKTSYIALIGLDDKEDEENIRDVNPSLAR